MTTTSTAVQPPLSVADVQELTRRSRNFVCDAANSGALESLPRYGRRHQFLPEHVQDWIRRGTPLMPHKPGRKRPS